MASNQVENPSPFSLRWEYVLIAAVLSGGIAFVASNLVASNPESYSQLIVGSITWNRGLKQPDYVLLFSLISSFLLVYLGLYTLSQFIRKSNGASAEFAFRQLLIYSLLPCAVLLGKALVTVDDIPLEVALEFLLGSLLVIFLAISLAMLLAFKRLEDISNQEYIQSVGGSLLFVFFSILIGSALSLAVGRIHLAWQPTDIHQVLAVSGVGAVLFWLPLLKIWLEPFRSLNVLRSKLRFLLWAVQAFLPLFFLILLPTPWSVGKDKLYGYSFTYALPLLIVVAVVIAYVDWFRRFKSPFQLESESSIFSAVSPVGLIGLLLYLKAVNVGAGAMLADDYHWGEFLLPWWLLKNFGEIPFWDYEPARGLINYNVGLFANLFFGDTAAAFSVASVLGNALWMLPYLSISFLVISRTIGLMPAFLACLLMPMGNGLSEIDCITTVAMCGLGTAFFARQWSRWLLTWGITSVAMLLFAPGQGGLLILSTLPLAAFALFQAVRKERKRLLLATVGGILIFLLLCLVTPLGKMLVGAVRYGVEQSSINSVAHGIAWSLSVGSNPVLSYLLWEVIRTSWILVGILSGLLLLRVFVDKAWAERYRYAVFGIPILLLTILFIPRAAGRIDPGGLSRLGLMSIWAICLLLPIVLITAYGQRRKALSLIVVAFLGGILVGIPVPDSLFGKPTRSIEVKSLDYADSDRLGLPNLAHTFIDPAHRDRLRSIKAVLNAVIDPGETYLDLTNHSANYFYLGYQPPIAAGAVYNMPHRNQQLRALQRLNAAPPPIVLASADNILFDGGPVSLRAYLLYRYIVERYTPVKIEKFIYLVRPDRLQRLSVQYPQSAGNTAAISTLDQDEKLRLLDQVFRVVDLQKIPRAWGESFKSLKSALRAVKDIDATTTVELHSVKKTGQNTYQIVGKDPFIVFNVEKLNLNGRDAGVLAFDFSSDSRRAPVILKIYWGSRSTGAPSENTVVHFSAKQGKLIVPLDAAPRWLLAEGIKTIRVDVAEPAPCSTFSISNITLFQRAELEKS